MQIEVGHDSTTHWIIQLCISMGNDEFPVDVCKQKSEKEVYQRIGIWKKKKT